MANNNYGYAPFWDFVRAFDHQGAGVDHVPGPNSYDQFPHPPGGFPFGGHPHPFAPPHHFGFGPGHHGHHRGGRRGGPCQHESPGGDPSEEPSHPHGGPRGFGHHRRGGHHGPGGPGHGHGPRGPPPRGPGGFDLNALLQSLSTHPWAQTLRAYAEQAAQSGETVNPEAGDAENAFTPPIDIFATETQYVLHVAVPGAKKEDVGINWDSEKGVLNLAGVVYRQGDEEFLSSITTSERKVGVFERSVKLPPGSSEEKAEIDGDKITAKLEDGVLVVTVPKVEKEWTDVKRVDID